jgi:hypothetical protein
MQKRFWQARRHVCDRPRSTTGGGNIVRPVVAFSVVLPRPTVARLSAALAGFAITLLAVTGSAAPAKADGCKRAPGMAASIDKFIDEVYRMQVSGQGSLPVADALFGIDKINAEDLRDLNAREPIRVTRAEETGDDEANGVFRNAGPKSVVINGNFAKSSTFFDIPPLVSGSYISTPDSLTLIYDPDHAVKVGQTFLGMKFSRTINHTVITRRQLSYFFDANRDGAPDRCYQLVDN